jgi:hypothetical protein
MAGNAAPRSLERLFDLDRDRDTKLHDLAVPASDLLYTAIQLRKLRVFPRARSKEVLGHESLPHHLRDLEQQHERDEPIITPEGR